MGIKDLSKMLRPSKVSTHQLSSLKTMNVQVLGVDAMMWLHKCLHRSTGIVDDFHCQPPISMKNHVWTFLTEALEFFKDNDLKFVLVFDGCKNPLKMDTDTLRAEAIHENQEAICEISAEGVAPDWRKLRKHKSGSIYVRSDVVANMVQWAERHNVRCIGAPFEADYQLVQLEKENITQGSLCDDSDLFPLGAKLMVQGLKMNKNEALNCSIVLRAEVLSKPGFVGYSDDDVVAFCVLLGCDYVSRFKGNGRSGPHHT
jgi:exonuclease-1